MNVMMMMGIVFIRGAGGGGRRQNFASLGAAFGLQRGVPWIVVCVISELSLLIL